MRKIYFLVLSSILIFDASGQNNKNLKKEEKMKTVVHRSEDRGAADHGWLKARHSFSFAGYYNPAKTHFGTLRVLNDDSIAAGKGFGSHPHDNMEIVTIPLEGDLAHQDNMGNKSVIRKNDVQIMSAGTGVVHSEFNNSKTDYVKLLQIWIFPKIEDIKPRYEQKTYTHEDRKNKFQVVVSPDTNDGGVWINQDAYFSLGDFEKGKDTSYKIRKPENGAYIFILEGSVEINGEKLNRRDAIGISNFEKVDIKINENAEILLIDLPMN
ncbi:MAG TPA: pirin family protein [Cytophagaceae bacterium]|nr:pirin family protein [Cytophagaceae bacterium]